MPLLNMLFILEDIEILHKEILTSTTEMVLGVVVGLPEQYYTTTLEKREKYFSLYSGQQYLAGTSVQPWLAWSRASKLWSPPGILLGLTKDRRESPQLLCPCCTS